jgi:hypothetical protein
MVRAVLETCVEANEFKQGYQPRTNVIKDERGELLVDPYSMENKCKNNVCHFFVLIF